MLSGGWGSGEPGLLDLAVPSARFNPDCAAIMVWTIAGFAAGSVAMKREQCPVRSIGGLGREGLADHLLPSLQRPSQPFSRDAPLGHNLPLAHHRANTWASTTARGTLFIYNRHDATPLPWHSPSRATPRPCPLPSFTSEQPNKRWNIEAREVQRRKPVLDHHHLPAGSTMLPLFLGLGQPQLDQLLSSLRPLS